VSEIVKKWMISSPEEGGLPAQQGRATRFAPIHRKPDKPRGGKPRKRLDSEGCLGFYPPVSDLFATAENSFKSKLQSAAQRLAASNIFVGTSSWKYEGWCGQIYDEQRYHYRGKFAETRFERDCLNEYAEVFKTVCVDAAYYQFPSTKCLDALVTQVPDEFLFTCKVTDDITLKRFTKLPHFDIAIFGSIPAGIPLDRRLGPNQHCCDKPVCLDFRPCPRLQNTWRSG
jgi:hypothetical protein